MNLQTLSRNKISGLRLDRVKHETREGLQDDKNTRAQMLSP